MYVLTRELINVFISHLCVFKVMEVKTKYIFSCYIVQLSFNMRLKMSSHFRHIQKTDTQIRLGFRTGLIKVFIAHPYAVVSASRLLSLSDTELGSHHVYTTESSYISNEAQRELQKFIWVYELQLNFDNLTSHN